MNISLCCIGIPWGPASPGCQYQASMHLSSKNLPCILDASEHQKPSLHGRNKLFYMWVPVFHALEYQKPSLHGRHNLPYMWVLDQSSMHWSTTKPSLHGRNNLSCKGAPALFYTVVPRLTDVPERKHQTLYCSIEVFWSPAFSVWLPEPVTEPAFMQREFQPFPRMEEPLHGSKIMSWVKGSSQTYPFKETV